MDGVECAGGDGAEADHLHAEDGEAGLLDAGDDFTLEVLPHAVGFENCECTFDCHKIF